MNGFPFFLKFAPSFRRLLALMAEWQPQQEGLQQLVGLMSQTQVASQEVQQEIYRVRGAMG